MFQKVRFHNCPTLSHNSTLAVVTYIPPHGRTHTHIATPMSSLPSFTSSPLKEYVSWITQRHPQRSATPPPPAEAKTLAEPIIRASSAPPDWSSMRIPVRLPPVPKQPIIKSSRHHRRHPPCQFCGEGLQCEVRHPMTNEFVRFDCFNSCNAREFCRTRGDLEVIPFEARGIGCSYCGMPSLFRMSTIGHFRFYCYTCIPKFAQEDLIMICIDNYASKQQIVN